MNEEKTKEIKDRIKTHRAMIESLRIQLKDVEDNKPYGPVRECYLKAMKGMTSPFASYNDNLSSYLKDPDLHKLKKSLDKATKFMLKTLKDSDKLINLSKINKKIEKLTKIEKTILENPAHIRGSSASSKEVISELNTLKEWLGTCRTAILSSTLDPQSGVSKVEAVEQLIRTVEKAVTPDS